MRALLRRLRRQCARHWHSVVPLRLLPTRTWQPSSSTYSRCAIYCDFDVGLILLSALLALPLFVLLLFISGLSDHFFETPFDQFRWTDVDVREQVIRELLGSSNTNTNLRNTDQPQVVNPWPKFFPRPLIEPTCRHNNNMLNRRNFVLIIVKTAPDRLERRDAVRATYGALRRYPPSVPEDINGAVGVGGADAGTAFYRMRTIFVLGRPPDAAQLDALEREAAMHGDLLVGDFADTYFNNTLKFVHSVRFARRHCTAGALSGPPVPYTLLLDDDFVLFPWNLVAELHKHVPNDRTYMGWRFDTSPFRARWFKWRVSLDEFPFNAFPPYIAAGAVLLTGQTIAEFYAAIPYTPLFRLDDIYAGILAYLLAIRPQHNVNFVFNRPPALPQSPSTTLLQVAIHDYSPAEMRQVYAAANAVAQRHDTLPLH